MKLLLKVLLEKRGVTQYQLAKAIGVSQPSVAAWMNGRVRNGKQVQVFPDLLSLEKICVFLKAEPSELLELDESAVPVTYENFTELAVA